MDEPRNGQRWVVSMRAWQEALASRASAAEAALRYAVEMRDDSCRLVGRPPWHPVTMGEMLEAAIAVTGATMGNIQLFDPTTNALTIVAERGFRPRFLDFFACVHDGEAACGASLTSRRRVVVDDVTDSPIFFGSAALEVMLDAGARAVQSTPFFDNAGQILGVVSTHYRAPRRLNVTEHCRLDMLAFQVARVVAP